MFDLHHQNKVTHNKVLCCSAKVSFKLERYAPAEKLLAQQLSSIGNIYPNNLFSRFTKLTIRAPNLLSTRHDQLYDIFYVLAFTAYMHLGRG